MIDVAAGQGLIRRRQVHHVHQNGIELLDVGANDGIFYRSRRLSPFGLQRTTSAAGPEAATANDAKLDNPPHCVHVLFVILALPNAPSLSARLTTIIDLLCQAAAARVGRRWRAWGVADGRSGVLSGMQMVLLWTRLRRVSHRLAALAARAAAGRALTRRYVAPLAPIRQAPAAPFPRLPHKFAWLVRLVPEAASSGSQLRHLLAEPEMAALVAASPQARRLLRPLCRMLAVEPLQAARQAKPPPDRPDPFNPRNPPASPSSDAGVARRTAAGIARSPPRSRGDGASEPSWPGIPSSRTSCTARARRTPGGRGPLPS